MKAIEMDTIHWSFDSSVPMWTDGKQFEITETKLGGFRLWSTIEDTQLVICDTLTEAKQEAELFKHCWF
jgi:hypothetical protein